MYINNKHNLIQIFERALASPISDDDIQRASIVVAAETARLQREREASPGRGQHGQHSHRRHPSGSLLSKSPHCHGQSTSCAGASAVSSGVAAAGFDDGTVGAGDAVAGLSLLRVDADNNDLLLDLPLDLEEEYLDLLMDLDLMDGGTGVHWGTQGMGLRDRSSVDVDAMAEEVFGPGHRQQQQQQQQ